MDITRENLKNKKIQIIDSILTKDEKKMIDEIIYKEIDDILYKFEDHKNEGMIDE